MSHQGNVCLGYHLVLNVTIRVVEVDWEKLSGTEKKQLAEKTKQLAEESIKKTIEYHANETFCDLHSQDIAEGRCYLVNHENLESQKNKICGALQNKPGAKKLGNVVIIWGMESACASTSDENSSANVDCQYKEKREQCEREIESNNIFFDAFHEHNPQVVVEKFFINIPRNSINRKDDETSFQGLYKIDTQPFWYLGRRVRAAFTEYQHEIYKPLLPDRPELWCHQTSRTQPKYDNTDEHSCGLKSIGYSGQDFLHPATTIRKILDIRDAIDLVCEGLDGSMDFFPPVPRPFQTIIEGKANKDPAVRVRYKFPFGVWFRGAKRVCYGLEPSLFRENHSKLAENSCPRRDKPATMYAESSMIHQFMFNKPHLRNENHDIFEWLCLMQHHDMPSRLLDWTENILTALYFAVENTQSDKVECDAMIWALSSARLNEITRIGPSKRMFCVPDSIDVLLRSAMAISQSRESVAANLKKMGKYHIVVDILEDSTELKKKDLLFLDWLKNRREISEEEMVESQTYKKLAYPVAVLPFRINERQALQQATFTLYGGKQYDPIIRKPPESLLEPKGLIELSRELLDKSKRESQGGFIPNTAKPFLEMFIVPSCAKRKIREQLKRIGVHSGTLFPELDKQAWYLRHQWRFEAD